MQPQKLDWDKVTEIRKLYKPGVTGYKTLARMFNVTPETIKSIIRGDTWPEEKRRYFAN